MGLSITILKWDIKASLDEWVRLPLWHQRYIKEGEEDVKTIALKW